MPETFETDQAHAFIFRPSRESVFQLQHGQLIDKVVQVMDNVADLPAANWAEFLLHMRLLRRVTCPAD